MQVCLDDVNQPQIEATHYLKIAALGPDVRIQHGGIPANRICQQVADILVGSAEPPEYHRDHLALAAVDDTKYCYRSKGCARTVMSTGKWCYLIVYICF